MAVEVKKKRGKRKLLLIHFNAAISYRLSYQNASHLLLYPQALPPHTELTLPTFFSSIIVKARAEEERKTLDIPIHGWNGAIPE